MTVLLTQSNDVIALDTYASRVGLINQGKSFVVNAEIEYSIVEKEFLLASTLDKAVAYKNPASFVVAMLTDYHQDTNDFVNSSIEEVVGDVLVHNENAMIEVNSTVTAGIIWAKII